MSRALSITMLLAAVCMAGPSFGQDLASAARDLIRDRSGAAVGCLVNGHRQVTEKQRENALVWRAASGSWRAVVARSDVNSATTAVTPCWTTPGRCAVFRGSLPDLSSECTRTRTGMAIAGPVRQLLYIAIPSSYGATVLAGGDSLMRLAGGLMPDDTLVTAIPGADIFMSVAADGALRARFVIGSKTVNIARLRTDPTDLDPAKLLASAQMLGDSNLVTAGPIGAVSIGGIVVRNNKCFDLADPSTFRTRLTNAENVFEISGLPATGAETERAHDDLLQGLLKATFSHGPAQSFSIEQDPRIFLSATGKAIKCPG